MELILEGVRETLERFRVRFDRFFSERSLHEEGRLGEALDLLEEREHVYPQEGAVWLRTTTFGDDKDRVLMRSNGENTYFAADAAYHRDKLERGYDRAINVLGADHHGYVGRIRGLWQALGGEAESFEIVIMQLVNLMEGGRRAQMSKRQGTIVPLDELIDDIGVDAARYFLLQRSHDTTIDLDLELARRHTDDNPVYYLQYAHARIASILRKAGREEAGAPAAGEELHPSERALVKKLLEFPGEVTEAAERRAPHRIASYLHEAARDFSAFYRDCKVIGHPNEEFRIGLCVSTRGVLAAGPRPARRQRPRGDVVRRSSQSIPARSVAPWAITETSTVRAAMLRIRLPFAMPSPSTNSEKVIVATPRGPNQAMKALVGVSRPVRASATATATGRASRRVTAAIATVAAPSANRPSRVSREPKTRKTPSLTTSMRSSACASKHSRTSGRRMPRTMAATKTAMKPLPCGGSTVKP